MAPEAPEEPSSAKEAKSRAASTDPNAPKPPMTASGFFNKERRAALKVSDPDLSGKPLTHQIAVSAHAIMPHAREPVM